MKGGNIMGKGMHVKLDIHEGDRVILSDALDVLVKYHVIRKYDLQFQDLMIFLD